MRRFVLLLVVALLPSIILAAEPVKPLHLKVVSAKATPPQVILDALAKLEQDKLDTIAADAALKAAQTATTADFSAFLKLLIEFYGPVPPTPPPPPAPVPVITSSLVVASSVGIPMAYQIVATNAPTSYLATGLPTELAIASVSGVISGTPIKSGGYRIGLIAKNSGGSGTAELFLAITDAPVPPPTPPAPVIQPIQAVVIEETTESTAAFSRVRNSKEIRQWAEAGGHAIFFLDKDSAAKGGLTWRTWADKAVGKNLPYLFISPHAGGDVLKECEAPGDVAGFLKLVQTYGGVGVPCPGTCPGGVCPVK